MSRPDAVGIFWQDVEVSRDRAPVNRPLPQIPQTGWTPPTEFPRLSDAKALCIDVETKDLGLQNNTGPGWATAEGGHVVGLGVGTDDRAWYFPIRHEVGGGNLEPEVVLRWAKDVLSNERQPKIGANILYDVGWLRREGVEVRGSLHDVQYAEPLLNEHRASYSLGSLAEAYGFTHHGKGDPEKDLYGWLADAYGGPATRRQAANIHRAPVALVGPYAEQDVTLPLRILRSQLKQLSTEGLLELYHMERALLPVLLHMRWRGVRLDTVVAERLAEQLAGEIVTIRKGFGEGADPNSPLWLQQAFDREGIEYPKTAKGNPSFTRDFLEGCPGELPQKIIELRRLEKTHGTYLQGLLRAAAVDGRIHAEFHPLRSDEGGTVSGRFSSSHPNLQNQPARDPEIRRAIRGLFLPEEGEFMHAYDYSQIEYRLMVHRAVGDGAEAARRAYQENPALDYHAAVQAMILRVTGRHLDRKPVKNVNFGKIFGMGEPRLRSMLGLSREEAHEFFTAYDQAVPFAGASLQHFSTKAAVNGHIRTILNRKARFPYYENRSWELAKKDGAMSLDEALAKYGQRYLVRRARTHKALNAYTQGSGGDIIKRAMLDMHTAGYRLAITVHDELVFSSPSTQPHKEGLDLMEHAVTLSVPLLVDAEIGTNWGNVK